MKKFITIVAMLFLIPFGISFCKVLLSINYLTTSVKLYFAVVTVFLFVFNKFIQQNNFYGTLKHELIHNFFAVLTFNKPVALKVGESGGSFYYMGKSNLLISLSPYFFPIVSFLLMFVSLLFSKEQLYYHILLGIATAFDISTSFKDIHPYQTDFNYLGYKKSVLVIILFMLVFYGILFSYVNGGFKDVYLFFESTLNLWVDACRTIYIWLRIYHKYNQN